MHRTQHERTWSSAMDVTWCANVQTMRCCKWTKWGRLFVGSTITMARYVFGLVLNFSQLITRQLTRVWETSNHSRYSLSFCLLSFYLSCSCLFSRPRADSVAHVGAWFICVFKCDTLREWSVKLLTTCYLCSPSARWGMVWGRKAAQHVPVFKSFGYLRRLFGGLWCVEMLCSCSVSFLFFPPLFLCPVNSASTVVSLRIKMSVSSVTLWTSLLLIAQDSLCCIADTLGAILLVSALFFGLATCFLDCTLFDSTVIS